MRNVKALRRESVSRRNLPVGAARTAEVTVMVALGGAPNGNS